MIDFVPPSNKKKYLFLYLPVDDNLFLRKSATDYANLHNLDIIEINTYLKNYKKDNITCIGDAGIEEFLSAIKYADTVFTNSFHAICFSVIFNVQFYAFSRAYAGKVKDICEVLGLSKRYFPDNQFEEQSPIDWAKVNMVKNRLVEKSRMWLQSALEKIDDK